MENQNGLKLNYFNNNLRQNLALPINISKLAMLPLHLPAFPSGVFKKYR